MTIANKNIYLEDEVKILASIYPKTRTINIVFHGHSVPTGFFRTPFIDTYNSYPYLLHKQLKDMFPFSVINPILTSIGGENAEAGEKRFTDDALCHKPDILTIDYGLNDRTIGLDKAKTAWSSMIEKALKKGVKVILLTPTWDHNYLYKPDSENWISLGQHAEQIRALAEKYNVALADSYLTFENYVKTQGDLQDLLSQSNHPNKKGHELVAKELMRWFPIV